jgi:hypothetical protein
MRRHAVPGKKFTKQSSFAFVLAGAGERVVRLGVKSTEFP